MRGIGSLALRYSSLNNNKNTLKPAHFLKSLSTSAPSGNEFFDDKNNNTSTFETAVEFEQRIFGGPSSGSFFQKLDRLEKARNRPRPPCDEQGMTMMDGLDETFNTLSDGMDAKLKKAATHINLHPQQFSKNDYSFRPDTTTSWPTPPGQSYPIKDADLRNPGVRRPRPRKEFKVTTEEVLRKADFRNVRFLANFITEAGIIIKRSKTGISAKAQRKVAREIKTARAFGLMPFTTMGTKPFAFGRNMEPLDEDYNYTSFDGRMAAQANGRDPSAEHKFVV